MLKKTFLSLAILLITLSISACGQQTSLEPPVPIPRGTMAKEIPTDADIIFSSIRQVLSEPECLENNKVKNGFINDVSCNKKFYSQEVNAIIYPKQLYALDLNTKKVTQLTNLDCSIAEAQTMSVVSSTIIMASAICADTDKDGMLTDNDQKEIYFLNLPNQKMNCLTCGLGLESINNPEYSQVTKKVVFSARRGTAQNSHHLFTIDANKKLEQLTSDSQYLDFDCSWSEDGTQIVFNRLPKQDLPWAKPAQIWLADANGKNLQQITKGGANPNNEPNHGLYPIGLDADPDLSPDNKKIAFSRLKTAKQNEPFGIYELVIIDVETKEENVLDSSSANMIPVWKSQGMLLIKQSGAQNPQQRGQSLYLYKDNKFEKLEDYPYDVYPVGAYGAAWVE